MSKQQLSVSPEQLEKYVRSRVKDISNPELFERELKESIEKKSSNFQKCVSREAKRNQIIRKHSEKQLQRRESLKGSIEEKQKRSEIVRLQGKNKNQSKKKQRQFRNSLFMERLSTVRQQENRRQLNGLAQYQKKYQSHIKSSQYLQNDKHAEKSNYLQKREKIIEAEYQRRKELAKSKKIFDSPNLEQRQLSLNQMVSKQHQIDKKFEEQWVEKTGAQLWKIEQKRNKKQTMIQQKVKRSQSVFNYNKSLHQERLKEIQRGQEERRKKLNEKLEKSMSVSKVLMSTHNKSTNLRESFGRKSSKVAVEEQLVEGASNQNQELRNYRHQINAKINEYLEKKRTSIHNK